MGLWTDSRFMQFIEFVNFLSQYYIVNNTFIYGMIHQLYVGVTYTYCTTIKEFATSYHQAAVFLQ